MARRKDVNWRVPDGSVDVAQAQLAVLMDLRDELKQLNSLLGCYNVRNGMIALQRIDKRLRASGMLTRKQVKK